MKKKLLFLSAVSLIALPSLGLISYQTVSVQAEENQNHGTLGSGSHTLRILNVEDYIYESDDPDSPGVVDRFKSWANAYYGVDDVQVVYDTTDTPETMFNELKINAGGYDLICPSDYMIQKLIVNDMISKLDMSLIPNYTEYASKYIKEKKLDCIEAVNSVTGTTEKVGDYAVGYMWGTLGIVFDPEYGGREMEKTVSDMQSWDVLWNSDYQGIATVKDSVRDTYAVGLLHTYDDDYEVDGVTYPGFSSLKEQYDKGQLNKEQYNEQFSNLFNKCDDNTITLVNKDLDKLLGNVFGLEVDQGKQDIVTGKIGINFAWSGDAVYSLDQAEDETLVSKTKELYYSIPETGTNVWFDAWVMPKYEDRSAGQYQLAHDFLNFISDPVITALNMDSTGYTSFIGGEAIRDLILDWYDARTDMIYYGDDGDSLFYYDPTSNEPTEVDYTDCFLKEDIDHDYDNIELYLGSYDEDEKIIIGEKINEKYNERLMIDEDLEVVDLSYFFNGTLPEDDEIGSIFYSDCYLPFENEDGSHNICVGRQFFTQYPDEETLTRCAVMRDFGDQNKAVLAMWEKFKSTGLPTWAIILFVIELVAIGGGVSFYMINKHHKKALRKKRLAATK